MHGEKATFMPTRYLLDKVIVRYALDGNAQPVARAHAEQRAVTRPVDGIRPVANRTYASENRPAVGHVCNVTCRVARIRPVANRTYVQHFDTKWG